VGGEGIINHHIGERWFTFSKQAMPIHPFSSSHSANKQCPSIPFQDKSSDLLGEETAKETLEEEEFGGVGIVSLKWGGWL